MQILSYKDWIAGRHHLKGRAKQLQEDIVTDDLFPDTTSYDEMLAYLKRQNASENFIRTYHGLFFGFYKLQVLDRNNIEAPYRAIRKRGDNHARQRTHQNHGTV